MVLFDDKVQEVLDLINKQNPIRLKICDELVEDVGKNNMIFSSESAYELGGGLKKSLSFDLTTSKFVNEDSILLIGKDLSEIKEDTDFIRISIIKVEDDKVSGNELYDRLERIKFTKYRVSPKGYMLRTTMGNREKVRVSKELANTASFSQIGSAYIKAYKQIPFVNRVIEVFITGECELYNQLESISKKKDEITNAIDHILKGMAINDCNACSVKELCDEVEGMREIHKGN